MSRPSLGALRGIAASAAAAFMCSTASWAQAQGSQDYPVRPIRFIVTFSPGAITDTVARTLGQKMSEGLGQPIIIDNRPGAGGVLGVDVVAKAAANGYTLLLGTVGLTILPHMQKLPYDPLRDLAPVSIVTSVSNVLVTNLQFPPKTVRELIVYAQSRPREISYASAGNGTTNHLAGAWFDAMAGIRTIHVPYKGGVQASSDLLAGNVQTYWPSIPVVLPLVKAGRLRALAVTGPQRTSVLPEVPTMIESGLPEFEVTTWIGVLTTGRSPAPVINRLNAEILRALQAPDVKQRLGGNGSEVVGSSAADFAAFLKSESAKWGTIVKISGSGL